MATSTPMTTQKTTKAADEGRLALELLRQRDPATLPPWLRKWVQGPSTDEYLDCYLARFAKVCPRVDEVVDMAWNGTTVPFAAYDFFKKTILPQAFDVAAQDVDRVAESLAGTEAEQEA